MTHVTDPQSLIDLDAVSESLQPMARITLEPQELSERHSVKFQNGFDGLDYLVFAKIMLGEANTSFLVRHQNAPKGGTLIYIEANSSNISLKLSKTIDKLGLSWSKLDWIRPEVELHQLAGIYANQGQVEQAISLYQQSLEIQEKIGNIQGKAISTAMMAQLKVIKGDVEEAIQDFHTAIAVLRELKSPIAQQIQDDLDTILQTKA